MAVEFITLPDELQNLANELLAYLASRGYRHTVEPNSVALPATPTVVAVRSHETHYFIVRQAVSVEEIDKWFRYACSCTSDTRISICCPENNSINLSQVALLRRQYVGLTVYSANGFEVTSEA